MSVSVKNELPLAAKLVLLFRSPRSLKPPLVKVRSLDLGLRSLSLSEKSPFSLSR